MPSKWRVGMGLLALSVTVKVPAREPVAVGVKDMLTVQLVPPASAAPHVFVCA